MMNVMDFQRGGESLLDYHRVFTERKAPLPEMKVSGGPGFEQDWSFREDEGKGFLGSRATSTTTDEHEVVSSSTDSTVEDDDYIAELTRQMTRYMLQDDDKHVLHTNIPYERNEETWGCVGWPSNTMWSPLGSSSGSLEVLSEEPSPPVTPREVHYTNSENKSPPSYAAVLCNLDKLDTNKLGSSASRTTQVAQAENPKQGVAFDESQEDSKVNLTVKQERSTKKQNGRQPNHTTTHQIFEPHNLDQRKDGYVGNSKLRVTPPIVNILSTPWFNKNSNMRAILLSGSGGGCKVGTAPSSGTGVFLPCVIGNTSPSPKNKRGSAPVLIPAKVVQALKVHFDRVGDHLARQNHPSIPIQNDSSNKGGRKTCTSANRKRHSKSAAVPPQPDMNNNNDMGLPQEWTY